MKGLDIEVGAVNGVAVAILKGDIDVLNGEAIAEELLRAGLTSPIGLVADLSDVRYADSAGVRTLFGLATNLGRARLAFAVAISEGSPLRRLLKVTNFDEVVPTLPTLDDAVALLRGES